MQHILLKKFNVFSFITITFFCTSCANIIPPSGGPRDSLPPILMESLPKDSTINFNSKKITLTFDEFVEVKEVLQNVIINPTLTNQPNIDYKLKNVFITFKDSLKPNTTYSINFGNSIKDVNEGNIARNKTYVFSTGKTIDKNIIKGTVIVAKDGSVDSTLIAVLHNNLNDTAIYKLLPQYTSKLNGQGEFIFHNLPDTTFNLFIIPNGFIKKYTDSTKLFGFENKPIKAQTESDNNVIYVFKEKEEEPKKPSIKSSEKIKFSLQTNIVNGRFDVLDSSLIIISNKAIKKIDSSSISILDSNYKSISPLTFNYDSVDMKIKIDFVKNFSTKYYLIVNKTLLIDSISKSAQIIDTTAFVTFREVDYGKLKLRCNKTISNEVLVIYKDDLLIKSLPITKEMVIDVFKPGEYTLRVLYDENKNGFWDTGNYKSKKQPEKFITLKTKLLVRAKWDNELEISW